jgi:hypothetical protein
VAATWETVCAIAAALPGTELDPPPRDNPAWRVHGKVLVRRNPRLRIPEEEALRRERGEPIAVHLERDERDLLVASDPGTFFFTPHWASSPSVLVWLDRVDPDLLRELIADAWRARAPKRLVREFDRR